MTLLSILTTTEFYVTAFIFAAAIVAYFALPRHRGPARQVLLAGKLYTLGDDAPEVLEIDVEPDGTVRLTRRGIPDLSESGAASLAVEIRGFDIEIKERITRSDSPAWRVDTAVWHLEGLAPERYHISYRNPQTQQVAAATLNVRPGIHIQKSLTR